MLSGGVKQWQFTWNSLNQLTSTITPEGHRWTYLYDALNRRVSKTHYSVDGVELERYQFTWDGPTMVEQTHTTTQGAATTTWEHEGLTPIAQTRTSTRSQAQVDAEFAAIITDLVGTPIRLLDTTGTTTWTNHSNTWGATTADTAMPLRFPGQYHDTETGLHYNLNRYYNPDTGRYITTDPLGLTPSPNPTAYVPNPTTAIDPLGLNDHSVNENATNTAPEAIGPARSTDLVLDSLRGLGPGKQKTVRTVGSVEEMRSIFDAWTVGAERLPARGPKVPDVYRLPDGGVIQWRTSSASGGPTIDIFPPNGAAQKVHLAEGVQW